MQENSETSTLIAYAMLPNEQLSTLMHHRFLAPTTSSTAADSATEIRKKKEVVLQVGFRRFVIQPLLSTHLPTLAFRPSSKNRQPVVTEDEVSGQPFLCSALMPVTFNSINCMLFSSFDYNSTVQGEVELISSGTVLGPDLYLPLLKRVVLVGRPFKIHKKCAVIRELLHFPGILSYFIDSVVNRGCVVF